MLELHGTLEDCRGGPLCFSALEPDSEF